MRNVHPCKRPIPKTVNSNVDEQLIGRALLFEPLHPSLKHSEIVTFSV